MKDVGYSPNNQYDVKHLIIEDRFGYHWDFKNFLVELNVYHSIFQMTSTANLVVYDPVNLRSNSAIMGGERVRFKFKNAGFEDYQELVYIVKNQGELVKSDNASFLHLQLITEEAYKDASLSRSFPFYAGYSNVIETAFGFLDSNKKFNLGNISNGNVGVTPFSSPLTTIRWATSNSYDSQRTPFMFYEDLDGFVCQSLGDMLKSKSQGRFIKEPLGMGNDHERDLFNIRELEFKTDNFNVLKTALNKIDNRLEYTFDIFTKECKVTPKNYSEQFQRVGSLEPFQIPQSKHKGESQPVWYHTFPDASEEGLYIREMYMVALESFGIKVLTLASDHLRVGKVYDFNIISNELAQNGIRNNEKYISGRFLLTRTKRTFKTTSYSVVSELVKDSISEELKYGSE